MKVAVSYPPLDTEKGVPLLSQNRQFQYFNNKTFIYPVVPASAATVLKKEGYDVAWLDGIAEEWSYEEYCRRLADFSPDLLAIESKTPSIQEYWGIIDDLKARFPQTKIVLMGDHVTALPEESMQNSKVDYVVTGGHFDFNLLELANALSGRDDMKQGVYYRDGETIKNTGPFQVSHSIKGLPMIDRDLTRWPLYAYKNGNFKHTPATYTMVGRDCWWRQGGGCTFCSWTSTFPTFQVAQPEELLDEVGHLIEHYGIREIFDDTGTFPIGSWLQRFCKGMVERGYNKHIKIGCNMRPSAIKDQKIYDMMGEAGFRFILYGLESANQKSLEMLNKGGTPEDMRNAVRMAKSAGLEPHVTCMVGYPWETLDEAKRTIAMTRELFDIGWIDTLQATIVIPYPGTQLFKQCEENGWLKTRDWKRYDMREPIMKTDIPDEEILKLTQDIYKSFMTPRYIARKVLGVRSVDDAKYLVRGGQAFLGHFKDFMGRPDESKSKTPEPV